MKHSRHLIAVSLSLIATVLANPTRAETINCTAIDSIPYVITVQGVYCFTGDLATSISTGNAIEIQTNNVILDMNGFKLGGLAGGTDTQANGIYALQRKNITIKNGTIRGFKKGIYFQDFNPHTQSQSHVVEDIRADFNRETAIAVYGQGSIIRRNQIVSTGIPEDVSLCGAKGIEVAGPGVRVIDNDVTETRAGSCSGTGILASYADGGVVRNNRVSGVSAPVSSWGILTQNSDNVVARANDIADPGELGLTITLGSGIYMENLVTGATVNAYSGTGTAAGATNYSD